MIICYLVISMDIQIQGPGDALSSNGPGFNSRKFVQLFGYHYWICSDLLYFWIFGCFDYTLSLVIVWVHPQFFLREYIKRNFVGYFSLVNLFCRFNLDVIVIYWSCSWDLEMFGFSYYMFHLCCLLTHWFMKNWAWLR